MQAVDWILVVLPLVVVVAFAIYTNRYVKSVADFLSGGRCAGRYLLANARGESDAGLANTMAMFERILISGFVLSFWDKLFYPVILLFSISGFVVYRFRETRAMTLAQFLEIRYSRPFRLYMGTVAFISGILNYGIFPAISARFFIYFLDLPLSVHVGPFALSTFVLIMILYLSCTVFLVLVGGQATMMIVDCLEGVFSHAVYIILALAVFYIVSWSQIVEVMNAAPKGESLINPFEAGNVSDFNLWFVMMSVFIRLYSTMAMQNKQGFNSAARTAHESRMGGVLGEWRGQARALMLLTLCVCAITFLRHPAFAHQAEPIHRSIGAIKDVYLQKQMTIPIALRYLLPVGMRGLFCGMMIMGLLAGDSGHLHSWGSIFVQDVILPFRKTPMTPKQHIWAIRFAVAGVAAFACFFSTVFTQTQYINLWWNVTGAIFTGGAGAAIIGGLYWKKGTTSAAWAAAIVGSALSVVGILCGSGFWDDIVGFIGPTVAQFGIQLPAKFYFNNQVSAFLATLVGAIVYCVTSLLTSRTDFNLNRMLHRGEYALPGEGAKPPPIRKRFTLQSMLQFDHNFTFADKITAGGIFWWSVALLIVNLTITVWHFISPWPISWWAMYWMINGIVIPLIIALISLVWFGIGGLTDMRDFFRALRTMKRDSRDDGRVVGHHNLAEEPLLAILPAGEKPIVALGERP